LSSRLLIGVCNLGEHAKAHTLDTTTSNVDAIGVFCVSNCIEMSNASAKTCVGRLERRERTPGHLRPPSS
jgi:hypothetical protein